MAAMTDKQIAAYEAKGFNRWTKGSMDRLYINIEDLGAEISYYGTGNVRSAKWRGEDVSNADGRRLLSTKVYIDIATGELNVNTRFEPYWTAAEQVTVEDAARELIAEIEDELAEEDEAESSAESEAIYRKGCEYPADGTPSEVVRRHTYKTIGNSYFTDVMDGWELAESVIGAADLLLADGADLRDVTRAISSHLSTVEQIYDIR